MAKVICKMVDCVHRSKRPMRKWRYQDGSLCYGCSLDVASVTRISDLDGDIEAVGGPEIMAHCSDYKPGQVVMKEFE